MRLLDTNVLREEVHDALYQEAPGFESIQTIADLERGTAVPPLDQWLIPERKSGKTR